MTKAVSIAGDLLADIVRLNCRCLAECMINRHCQPTKEDSAVNAALHRSAEELILLFLIEAEFAAQQIVADLAQKTGYDKAAEHIRKRAKKDYVERMAEREAAATEQTELPA